MVNIPIDTGKIDNIPLKITRVGKYEFAYVYSKKNPLTLVMIHGHGASNEYLRPVFKYPNLAKYSVLIPDLIGFGDTPAPADFSYKMEDQALAVKQLMYKLGISGNVVLLGSSMGGAIAVFLAEALKRKVKGIILAEGTLDISDCSAPNQAIAAQPYDLYEKTVFWRRLDELRADPEYSWVVKSQEKAGPISCYKSIVDYVKVAREDTLITKLANLGIPILGIYGEKNKGLRTSDLRLSKLKDSSVVYIPNAGHVMMYDNPEAYHQAIENFMYKIENP
jgi:pimeloyl-ACP methyl ester carboxylesterase